MQGDINLGSGRSRVDAIVAQEGIKRGCRICIQECLSQSRLARLAHRKVLPFVSRIPETQFPVPRLEVIADPSHLTACSHVEELIPISEFLAPLTGVVNAAEANTSGNWEPRPIRKEVWNRCVCNGERIERIGEWHTDTARTKECPRKSVVERI